MKDPEWIGTGGGTIDLPGLPSHPANPPIGMGEIPHFFVPSRRLECAASIPGTCDREPGQPGRHTRPRH